MRRYLTWVCEGCDHCAPPYGQERDQTPCTDGASPSMNGAWVYKEEDVKRILRQQMTGDPEPQGQAIEDMVDRVIAEALS